MNFDRIDGTFKGDSKSWSRMTTLWRKLQDVLFAIFAILAWDSVANLAELAALKNMGDGSARYVRSLRATFILDTACTSAADGITVVESASGGRWIRQAQVDPYWITQAVWFVDPAAGSDENAGSAAAPIQTLSEFGRRVQNLMLRQTTTVNVLSDALATDELDLTVNMATNAGLRFVGAVALGLEAPVTSWSKNIGPVGPGNNDPGTLGLAGWTVADEAGKLVYFADGPAAGGWAWVSADLGAGLARVSSVLISNPYVYSGVVAPVVGNTAKIYSIPAINVSSIRITGHSEVYGHVSSALTFEALHVRPSPEPNYKVATLIEAPVVYALRTNFEIVMFNVWYAETLAQCAGHVSTKTYAVFQGGVYRQIDIYDTTSAATNEMMIDSEFPGPVYLPALNIDTTSQFYCSGPIGFFGDAWGPYLMAGSKFGASGRLYGAITAAGLSVELGAEAYLGDGATLTAALGEVHFPSSNLVLGWTQVPYIEHHTNASVLSFGADLSGGVSGEISVGIKGLLTSAIGPGSVSYALQDLTESPTELPKLAFQKTILGNLYIHLETGTGGAGNTVTVDILVDGVATGLTATLSGAATDASDTDRTHRFYVGAGDRISARVTAVDGGVDPFTAAGLSVSAEMA